MSFGRNRSTKLAAISTRMPSDVHRNAEQLRTAAVEDVERGEERRALDEYVVSRSDEGPRHQVDRLLDP